MLEWAKQIWDSVEAETEDNMIYKYQGFEFVVEPKTDFCMLEHCYYNGGNCFNCIDSDGCPIDLFSIEEIVSKGELV